MNNYNNFDDYYEHNSKNGLDILNKKLDIENKELDLKQRKHEWIKDVLLLTIVLVIVSISTFLTISNWNHITTFLSTRGIHNEITFSNSNSVTSVSNSNTCYLNGVKTNCSEMPKVNYGDFWNE